MATSKTRTTTNSKRGDPPPTSSQDAGDEQASVLQALFRIAEWVGSQRSGEEKLAAVLEIVREACGATAVRLTEPNDTEVRMRTVARAGPWPIGERRHRTVKAVFATGKPRVIDGPASTGYFGKAARAAGVASRAALPIVLNGRVTNVLTINAATVGFFTPERMRFLRGITSSLGSLLDNIRLQETERLQARTIETLLRVSDILGSAGELGAKADAALRAIIVAVDVQGATIWMPDHGSQELKRFASARAPGVALPEGQLPFGEGFAGAVWVRQQELVENRIATSRFAPGHRSVSMSASLAAFSLPADGEPIAVVAFRSDRPDHFDTPRVRLLRSITDALGAMLEKARLQEAERAESEALEALFRISSIVAGPLSFTEKLMGVLDEVKTVLEVDSADLRMPDAEEAGLRVVASVGSAQQPMGAFRAFGDSRTGRAFQSGEPIIAHDYEINHRGGPGRGRRHRSGYEAQSVAWLPVGATGRTVGVLAVDTAKRNHFNAHRLRILTTIADGIGTFIENAKLRETEHLHLQEMEVLNRTATIFAGGGTFEEKATSVLETIVEQTGDWATLMVADESGEHLSRLASTRPGVVDVIDVIDVIESIAGEAFSRGKPAVVNGYEADPRSRPDLIDDGVRSEAAFPVVADELPRAVLVVSSRQPSYFTPERVALLTTIAAGIGPSLEKARTSEQLQVAQQQLVQSGKLAAIGELAAGVAHEINNPLNSVMGFTQLLMEQDLPPQAMRDLEKIYAEGKRAARIVENLLVFARNSAPEQEAVDVRAVIDRACSLKGYDLRNHSVELRTHVADSLPRVLGDGQRLIEVVLNLLTNAEQAIASTARAGVITVRCEAAEDHIQIIVSDDGPGMPPEVLGRIFEPFFTTKEVGEGTGLGLSVCQGIVRQHQGELWAESELGAGATFHIELPIPTAPVGRSQTSTFQRLSTSGMRILVVDDEPSARDFMARVLSRNDHAVETAADGHDAWRRLQAGHFDCVIADLRMPGMSGQDLYRRAQESAPELCRKFIFVTGDTMSPDTLEFLSSTAGRALMKPINADQLRLRVAELQKVAYADG